MPTFLGKSGNAMTFLNPSGQMVNVAPEYLDPATIQSMMPQAPMATPAPLAAPQAPMQPDLASQLMFKPGEAMQMMQDPYGALTGRTPSAAPEQLPSSDAKPIKMGEGGIFKGSNPLAEQGRLPAMRSGMGEIEKGFGMQAAGIGQEAQAQKAAATAQQAEMDKLLSPESEYQMNLERGQQQMRDIQEGIATETEKFQKMSEAFQKEGAVNPNRLWQNASTGGKITAAISMALAGIGAGLTGGENQAVSLINKMIDRDLDAQKMDLEKKRSALGMQQSLVGMMRNQFQDADTAMMASKRIALDNAEMQLKKITAGLSGDVAKANASKLMGQLQLQKGQLDIDLGQKIWQQQALQSISGNGGTVSPVAAMALPKEVQDRLVKIGPNEMIMAINPEGAKTLQEKMPSFEHAIQTTQGLLNLTKETAGKPFPGSEKAAKMNQLKNELVFLMKDVENIKGTLTEPDIQMIEKIVADPASWLTTNNVPKLEHLITTMTENKQRLINQNAFGYRGGVQTTERKESAKIPYSAR